MTFRLPMIHNLSFVLFPAGPPEGGHYEACFRTGV